MWRCFVRDQARVPSVAGAASSLFRKTEQFFFPSPPSPARWLAPPSPPGTPSLMSPPEPSRALQRHPRASLPSEPSEPSELSTPPEPHPSR